MVNGKRASVPVPVICVGNFTVGGAGKTPTALALAQAAKAKGMKPGFLSRGYGGSLDVTTVVDPEHHHATAVGDEPLLLAREALTVIARRRAEGAERLVREGADLIIMDDGFQSAHIHFDYALIVVDARRGIGNGRTIPGGPLRAMLVDQMPYADAVLAVGEGNGADHVVRMAARAGKPVFSVRQRPLAGSGIAGRRVLAFAGIGDPVKFFRTVEDAGGEIVLKRAFADHHFYAPDELADLAATAERRGLELATTAKDAARIFDGSAATKAFLDNVRVVEIDMAFDPDTIPRQIIGDTLEAWRERRLAN